MTSRERFNASLDHREPDRVPLDLGTCETVIAREVYEGLAELLGLEPTAAEGVEHPGTFVCPDEKMLEALGIDTRHIDVASKPNAVDVDNPWPGRRSTPTARSTGHTRTAPYIACRQGNRTRSSIGRRLRAS